MTNNPLVRGRRVLAAVLIAFLGASTAVTQARPISPHIPSQSVHLFTTMTLRDGSDVRVYSNGLAIATRVDKKTGRITQTQRRFPVGPNDGEPLSAQLAFPTRQDIQRAFEEPGNEIKEPYASDHVIVVLRNGISAANDRLTLDSSQIRLLRSRVHGIAPQYTGDTHLNATLASLGTWRFTRLFQSVPRSTLQSMSMRAQSAAHGSSLDIANAYRVDLANSTIGHALGALRLEPSVAYVAPDYLVAPLQTGFVKLDQRNPNFATKSLREELPGPTLFATGKSYEIPTNYAVTASQQSMLNANGVNAVAAYDEVERTFHQLPGSGVRITNVSVGDIIDASDATGPCSRYETGNGPTTILNGGQRYLDLPTMPLIPVYTADATGNLGNQSVCGTGDGELGEIGMDFSVMSPLPDSQQRPGSGILGFGDLLGIAPGASYALVVPAASQPALSDIDASLLAAANQRPRPDIITASLGISTDSIGFPGRYLGDDPLTAAVMQSIATADGILLSVSANDGTRAVDGLGNVAIGASGGAAPTDVATGPTDTTTIDDVARSSFPSHDLDDGNIVAGATTLDDIFSAEPQNPTQAALASAQSFPETRWNGMTVFASGYGTLVSLAAPGDNIITFEHTIGGGASSVFIGLNGGTSASAPEIAAGAAVAIQVARAIGKPFTTPQALRAYLIQNGTKVPQVPQSDTVNAVGPQLNVATVVEQLLKSAGKAVQPGIARVAVAQRRDAGVFDAFFTTDTNRNDIDLTGPISSKTNQPTGENQNAPITIAPDWEAMPANTQYQLFVAGHATKVLATTPYARLTATQILAADGKSLAASGKRTLRLTYRARAGGKLLAQSTISLTFSSATGTANAMPAPIVNPVTTGTSIAVTYDLTNVTGASNPTLLVSEPGRINLMTGQEYHPAFTMALSKTKGTVQVPVDKLQGAGIYGIGVEFDNPGGPNGIWTGQYSDFAYTRIDDGSTDKPTSLLAAPAGTSAFGHYAEQPINSSYKLTWNASNVHGATGAILEVSTTGPSLFGIQNSFNNPNGSERDDNGVDTGSVYYKPLSGVRGEATFSAKTLGLQPSAYNQVRVLATNGSKVIGEAGDVITLKEDGVVPPDGGFIPFSNFGINANGTDGYFADNANILSTGQVVSSVNTFSLKTNAITNTVATGSGRLFYQLSTGAVYANDIGAYSANLCDPSVSVSTTFCSEMPNPNNYIVNPVATGALGAVWSQAPPFGGSAVNGALNPVNDEALLEGIQQVNGPPDVLLVLSNISANTIDQTFDVNGPLGPPGAVNVASVTENPNTNTAVLGYVNFANPNAGNCNGLCPQLAVENLTNGSLVGTYNMAGNGFPAASALDYGNNEILSVPLFSNQATLFNLGTLQTIATITLGKSTYPGYTPNESARAIADPVNHLFIVDQAYTPEVALDDNNPHEIFYVIDANGKIVKTISLAAFPGTIVFPNTMFQINPSLREAYIVSPDVSQIIPFNY